MGRSGRRREPGGVRSHVHAAVPLDGESDRASVRCGKVLQRFAASLKGKAKPPQWLLIRFIP